MKVAAAALLAMSAFTAAAASARDAGVVSAVEGAATVSRATPARFTALRHGDPIHGDDRITLAEGASLRALIGGTALVTVLGRAAFTAAPADHGAGLTVERGSVLYSLATGTLKPQEFHEVRTPNAVASLHDALVVIDVSVGPDTVTIARLCVMAGVARVRLRWRPGPERVLSAMECVDALGDRLDRPYAAGRRDMERMTTLTDRLPQPERVRLAMSQSIGVHAVPVGPGPWTLLADHGAGFAPWVGVAAEGWVAGDAAYVGVALATCDDAARRLAAIGVRVACAHSPWLRSPDRTTGRFRDPQGRLLAAGPLAGRLVAYEPDSGASNWRFIRLGDVRGAPRGPMLDSGQGGLALARCYAYLEAWPGSACFRASGGPEDYRDVNGALLAEGPFAGGLVARE